MTIKSTFAPLPDCALEFRAESRNAEVHESEMLIYTGIIITKKSR